MEGESVQSIAREKKNKARAAVEKSVFIKLNRARYNGLHPFGTTNQKSAVKAAGVATEDGPGAAAAIGVKKKERARGGKNRPGDQQNQNKEQGRQCVARWA